jgi:diadenosine tetraphosphate (Ap4A) HIT family hydrolase
MSFENLWAGWRSAYVNSVSGPASKGLEPASVESESSDDETTCVFCRIIASNAPDEVRNIVFESKLSVAMLNAFPYASGHLLTMPRRHVSELAGLSAEESDDLWRVTTMGARAIETAYGAEGMNIGANLGRAAGAGIPRHLHLHALPRWVGDTNFMTSVASTRVMPESLPDSYSKLKANWPT